MPDEDYEIVMPFVTVASRGGPHEDHAYVAGWEMGKLDARLAECIHVGSVIEQTIRTDNLPQADLLAMHHGFKLESRSDPDYGDEWTHIRLTLIDGDEHG